MNERPPDALHQWDDLVLSKAKEFGLDEYLLMALIWQESSGDPLAKRYEPNFVWFFHPEKGPLHEQGQSTARNRQKALALLGPAEFDFQTASHGLTQVMGSLARELDFCGTPEEFYDPEVNLTYGARYLSMCLRRTAGDTRQALLKYNGGADRAYPIRMLRKVEVLKNA